MGVSVRVQLERTRGAERRGRLSQGNWQGSGREAMAGRQGLRSRVASPPGRAWRGAEMARLLPQLPRFPARPQAFPGFQSFFSESLPHCLSQEGAACGFFCRGVGGGIRAGRGASSSNPSPILSFLAAIVGLHTTLCPPSLRKTRGSQGPPRETPPCIA